MAVLVLCAGGVGATPLISFENPTPANATSSANEVIINVSVTEPNLKQFTFNWNGVNNSLFDSSLKLWLNFNNYSSLAENDSYIRDLSENGNNATSINNAVLGAGKYGLGADLNGINQQYRTINSYGMNSSSFTWSMWFRYNDNNTEKTDYGEGLIGQRNDYSRLYLWMINNGTSQGNINFGYFP